MVLPKKGLRKITVANNVFAWSVTGNDNVIHLSIAAFETTGQLLTCSFDYHHKETGRTQLENGGEAIHFKQQFIITPKIVRRVIEYAFVNGWKPFEKGKQLNLQYMDDKIDLGLEETKNVKNA